MNTTLPSAIEGVVTSMAINPTLLRYLRVGTSAVLVQVYIQVHPYQYYSG